MMTLSIPTSLAPMEALLVPALPRGPEWQYEPKWDGFRCLAFRDGATIELRSKSGQPFNRYFPEIVAALRRVKAEGFALDDELVVPVGGAFSFDQLLQRIHPAASRVERLAQAYPALFIVFDLLAGYNGHSLLAAPLAHRRDALEQFVARRVPSGSPLHLSPQTQAFGDIERWFGSLGSGSTERSGEWKPLATKLVAEVQYDHFSGKRFRHGMRFLRWRPDKAPRQCVIGQAAQEAASTLALLDYAVSGAPPASAPPRRLSKNPGRKASRPASAATRRR